MAKTEYEESLKIFWDFSNVLSTAKREGKEEGRAEGRAEGLAEGRTEGRAEGEREEKLRNAKKMKDKGMDFVDISDITGLTEEEIEEL